MGISKKKNKMIMFGKIKNIDTAFRSVRLFCITVVCCSFLLCLVVIFLSFQQAQRLQDRMYVLAGDKVIEAYASDRKDNIAVEARDHVKNFHHWFFTLGPDEQLIQQHLVKALYLADGSAKRVYDNLTETGYYSSLLSGNISQVIQIDSVLLDIRGSPFVFTCYGNITITRPTSIVKRNLITRGTLRTVSRSDHNPHGFLIERWETLDNKDLSVEPR
jgi:conjugative transposon TraK protein